MPPDKLKSFSKPCLDNMAQTRALRMP